MQVQNAQEALYIACEMEKSAIQLYQRALAVMEQQGRRDEPLYGYIDYMLRDERQHLQQFSSLFEGLDEETERLLTLSAISAEVLFKGGLMAAVREGALKDLSGMLRYAMVAEEKAAATYRAFANRSENPQAREMLLGIAGEEDKHLQTLKTMAQ